jgi:hypothetical protein
METVKENNEELVIRSDNGTFIRPEKLADGGVRIHNSDGPSTKDAMQETRVKDAILKSFSDFVRLGSANKCISTKKNAGPELAKCILEYPKVIVEPHYTQDVKAMAEAFKEVSAIRLPFPKMTIISGERSDKTPTMTLYYNLKFVMKIKTDLLTFYIVIF